MANGGVAVHFFDADDKFQAEVAGLVSALPPDVRVTYHPGEVEPVPGAVVISPFVNSRVTAGMMAKMPDLRLIACRSTGTDNVDLAEAAAHGITVTNVPSYGENTVAEFAFGLLLALTRKIPQAIEQLRAGQTSHVALQGTDLLGKTLGILGAGRIGCRAAAIGRGFGMNVVAFDAFPDPGRAEQFGFKYLSQDEVLAAADMLSLHVPNIPSTRHLMDAHAFAKMKPTAMLVNTARGEVVDSGALIEALSSGRLAGAALDVFEGENVAGIDAELGQLRAAKVDRMVLEQSFELSILQKMPNVILTNHNAFNTREAVARINQTSIENITAFLAGAPVNQVKPPA